MIYSTRNANADYQIGTGTIATKSPKCPMRVSVANLFLVHDTNVQKAIKGKDCLVQKFRNSSVMLEHPTFRPKVGDVALNLDTADSDQIFRTGNRPDAGEEEDFPLPDNASKMRRSVENAEHVGQF